MVYKYLCQSIFGICVLWVFHDPGPEIGAGAVKQIETHTEQYIGAIIGLPTNRFVDYLDFSVYLSISV